MPAESETGNMRSLSRAIDVLEVLDDEPYGLRLTEIAQRVNLPVPTVKRILRTLEGRGRVERYGSVYRAGINLLFGAHAFLTGSELIRGARPFLQDLAAGTGLTASLFVRSQRARIVVARVEGDNPLRYELPVGERLPLHLGAGKALLAHAPDEELRELAKDIAPFETAGGDIVSPEDFLESLEEVRRSGYSVSENERVLGARSVASAVRGESGTVHGAIQVVGSSDVFLSERILPVARAVHEAASRLGRLTRF